MCAYREAPFSRFCGGYVWREVIKWLKERIIEADHQVRERVETTSVGGDRHQTRYRFPATADVQRFAGLYVAQQS